LRGFESLVKGLNGRATLNAKNGDLVFNTISGQVTCTTWAGYIKRYIPRSHMQIKRSIDIMIQKGIDHTSFTSSIPDKSAYERKTITIQKLNITTLVTQLKEQLTDLPKDNFIVSSNLEELMHDAATASIENYGKPSHFVWFGDEYVMFDNDKSAIELKFVSPTEGAILVYRPKSVVVAKVA